MVRSEPELVAGTVSATLQFVPGDATWHTLRKRCLTDLYWFAAHVLGYGERIPMRDATHALLCRFVEKRTGQPLLDEARYRKIEMPRETGKTTLVTQAYPIQRICANPDISILLCNEKEQNAKDFLSAIKHEFEANEVLRALFPEVIPTDLNATTWSASRIIVQRASGRKEPTIFVIGVGGTVTGMHPDLIICDDIISREAMENARAGSWQIMHQVNRWIHQLEPLLNSNAAPFPEILFIGTRWWHGDSYEHIEKAFGYESERQTCLLRVKLPNGEVQQLAPYRVGDLAVFRRAAIEDGRSIFPEKWDLDKLAKLRQRDEALFACLPPGERILGDETRNIEQLQRNDLVLTKEGRYRGVAPMKRQFDGEVVSVRVWGQGVPALLTPNHQIWTERGWVAAEHLVHDDVLSVPIHTVGVHRGLSALQRNPDFWFLVGHFIGDGTVNRKTGVTSHCFNKRDKALAHHIAGIVRRLFARKARIETTRTTLRITYRHPKAAAFFSRLSHGISQKWLPARYETLPTEYLLQLIAGYWGADGCVTKRGYRTACSVSHEWLCQLQRFFARLGEVAYVSKGKANTTIIEGRRVRAQRLYQIWVYTPATRKTKTWVANGRLYHKIKALTRLSYIGPVFNCEVVEDHSYVNACNVLTYKNCNFMNNPSDEVTATFKESWLGYYDQLDATTYRLTDATGAKRNYALADLDRLVFVDPGGFGTRSVEDRARAALVAVGTTGRGEHLLLGCYSEKDTFLACARTLVEWAGRYAPRKLVIEQAGQQAAFIELVRRMLAEAGLTTPIEAVKPGVKAKEQRILALEPLFQRGVVFLGRGPQFHEFREQFRQFPRSARLDVLDALAYLPQFVKKMPLTNASPAARIASELDAYYARRGLTRPA